MYRLQSWYCRGKDVGLPRASAHDNNVFAGTVSVSQNVWDCTAVHQYVHLHISESDCKSIAMVTYIERPCVSD